MASNPQSELWTSPTSVPHRQSVSVTPTTNSLSSSNGPSSCHKCHTPITGAQFIRVGDVSFHRDCFNCVVCNCPLADKKPRSKEGQFYCPDDFHRLFSHTCRTCNQLITSGGLVKALGHYFHHDHFVCETCKKPFQDGRYYEFNGNAYCPEHHKTVFKVPTCTRCMLPISDVDIISLKGQPFHTKCLHCDHCKIELCGESSVVYKDGFVLCREDYIRFYSRLCTKCGGPILKQIVAVNGESYHLDCFSCVKCNVQLDSYLQDQGHLVCNEHIGTPLPATFCSVCNLQIHQGVSGINCCGKTCHPNCFKCSSCGVGLEKSTTRVFNDKLSCIPCVAKTGFSDTLGTAVLQHYREQTHQTEQQRQMQNMMMQKSQQQWPAGGNGMNNGANSSNMQNLVNSPSNPPNNSHNQIHISSSASVASFGGSTHGGPTYAIPSSNSALPGSNAQNHLSNQSQGDGFNNARPIGGQMQQNSNSSNFQLNSPHSTNNMNQQTPSTGPSRLTAHQRQHSHFILPSTQPTHQAPNAPSTPQLLPSSALSPHSSHNGFGQQSFNNSSNYTHSAPNPSNPLAAASASYSNNQFAPSPYSSAAPNAYTTANQSNLNNNNNNNNNNHNGQQAPNLAFKPTALNLNLASNQTQSQRVQFQHAPSTPSHHVHHSQLSQFMQASSPNDPQLARPNSAHSGINQHSQSSSMNSQQQQNQLQQHGQGPQLALPPSLNLNTNIANNNKIVSTQPPSHGGSSTPLSNSSSFSSQSGFHPPINSSNKIPMQQQQQTKPGLQPSSQINQQQQQQRPPGPNQYQQPQPRPPSTAAPTLAHGQQQQQPGSAHSTPQSGNKYLSTSAQQATPPHQSGPYLTPVQPSTASNPASNDTFLTDEQRRQHSKHKLQQYHETIQKEKQLATAPSQSQNSDPSSGMNHNQSANSNLSSAGNPAPSTTVPSANPAPKPNYLAPANREQAHQRRENVEIIKRQQEQLKSGQIASNQSQPGNPQHLHSPGTNNNIANSSQGPSNQLRPSSIQTNNNNQLNQPVTLASPSSHSNSSAALSPTATSDATNDTFGTMTTTCPIEWRRGDLIGKGSFGKVYMGMNSTNGELIAIKQVNISNTDDLEAIQQLQTEIALMSTLRHPNVIGLLGTQRTGSKLNILMEYIPGKSLDLLLSTFGPFTEKVMVSYTRQLLDALAYCHDQGVVHRDIKGKNVLVDTNGNLKLADFGSAKRIISAESRDAPSLGYNYTPLWTAPEVLVGDYNSKVDIWSLGCVVIEMASGKAPWSEHNFEHPFRALYHIANTNEIPKIPDRLSPLGRDFILQCLSRDPDQRPSAKELLKHPWLRLPDAKPAGQ